MIIYLSFQSTATKISEIEKVLKKDFNEVVFDPKVYCFYCHENKSKEGNNEIIKKLSFYEEVQSYNFLRR